MLIKQLDRSGDATRRAGIARTAQHFNTNIDKLLDDFNENDLTKTTVSAYHHQIIGVSMIIKDF